MLFNYSNINDVKNITTKSKDKPSGMFKIRYESDDQIAMFYYNINEKEDNIEPSRPIFSELLATDIGKNNNKFNFYMVDKIQYIPERKEDETPHIKISDLSDLKIYNIVSYIPKWCNKNDEVSNRILDLKNRYPDAIQYFYGLTYAWLKSRNLLKENIIIAVIPSHEASNENRSGTAIVAHNIVKNSNVVNGINLIIRKKTIPKKSTSSNRPTLEMDISSLEINDNININDKVIVILDDVTTHGDSFRAAAYHLYERGASVIIPLAMGKTVIPNE